MTTGGVVLGGLSIVGSAQLQVDTTSIRYLYPDHPVRQDSRLIETNLGPYAPLEFLVRTELTVLRPKLLRAVRAWERGAMQAYAVGWHRSAADDLRDLQGAVGAHEVETTRRLRALLHLGRSYSGRLDELAAHSSQLRVTFGISVQSAQGVKESIATVRKAAAVLPKDVRIEGTGYLPLHVGMATLIVNVQLHSFGLAFVLLPLAIGLLFGGVWAAGWSLVPI